LAVKNSKMDSKRDNSVVAAASKSFDKFFSSEVFADVVDSFGTVCELLEIQPGQFSSFYPILKTNIKSCAGMNLFKLLDEKISHPIYNDHSAASNIKMTVIGCGPTGLRTAIEALLMGSRVTILEKRTSFTRNNVLHIWPWVIDDLKSLGAKNFYPRFCTGTMNHISIRRLQLILLKTALVLGVEMFGGVEFSKPVEPDFEGDPWTISVKPDNHPVAGNPVDVLIGAEGARVTLPGFKRKEFRGKLALAITANFVNKRTTAEAIVEEISGVAFVYKQDFFNNLYDELGIALENIVYYKDDTHYFVMTTKKHSLLDRKVLKKDYADPIKLLDQKNINMDQFLEYIRDTCDYCTDYQLPNMEFALTVHGKPDVALFDFTSMHASSNACHVAEKKSKQLLFGLVGDGLLEPFWPTGTGIARGFLGAFDAMWMVKQWAAGDMTPLEIIAERESVLRLLPQAEPHNITKDYKKMSIIPQSRYGNLNKNLYSTVQVQNLYQSDTPERGNVPRYTLPDFQEPVRPSIIKRSTRNQPVNITRFRQDHSSSPVGSSPTRPNPANEPNANDIYQVMRDKRRDDMAKERDTSSSPRRTKTLQEQIQGRRIDEDTKRTPVNRRPTTENNNKGGLVDVQAQMLKNILSDENTKAAFVKKMSKTFGYGMASNAEAKKDTLSSEAEKCPLLVKPNNMRQSTDDKRKRKKSGEQKKASDPVKKDVKSPKPLKKLLSKDTKAESLTKDPKVPVASKKTITTPKKTGTAPIEKFDFTKLKQLKQSIPNKSETKQKKPDRRSRDDNLHSSVAPLVPSVDIEIDPELDCLLAQLEGDEEFSKLGENDQKTWLESLFFQDTLHLPGRVHQPRDGLKKTKEKAERVLRVNSDFGDKKEAVTKPTSSVADPEASSDGSVHVNKKMTNLAQDFFKSSPKKVAESKPKTKSVENTTLDFELGVEPSPKPVYEKKPGSLADFLSQKAPSKSESKPKPKPVEDTFEIELGIEPSPKPVYEKKPGSLADFLSKKAPSTSPSSRLEPSPPKVPESKIMEDSIDEITGVNKNLCSLAQSYFQAPQKPPSRKTSTHRLSKEEPENNVKEESDDPKASLVASFFGSSSTKAAPNLMQAAACIPERASYEPDAKDFVDDDEDKELEELFKAAEKEQAAKRGSLSSISSWGSSAAPAVPPRKISSMLNRASNALKKH